MLASLQALLLVVTVFPRFLDTWDAVATARLEARFAAIRAAGDPVTMEELGALYPKLPPEKNGARFYEAAWEKMAALGEQPDALFEREPTLRSMSIDVPATLDDKTLRALKQHLDLHRKVFVLLDKATDFDATRFDLDFTIVPMPPLSYTVYFGMATQLYARAALYHTHVGEVEKAGEAIWRALRVQRATREMPFLIGALVHAAYTTTSVYALERTAFRLHLSPALSKRIETELREFTNPIIVERALIGDRCYGIGVYKEHILGERDFHEAVDKFWVPDLPWNTIRRIVPRGHIKDGQCAGLDFQAAEIAAARKPRPAGMIDWIHTAGTWDSRIPRCYPFARIGARDMVLRMYETIRDQAARCDAARVALACLRYRAKHKRLPDTLGALVPDFMDALPHDLYDGHPLRYRKDAKGFVVYAVGRNGKDDGGDTAFRDTPDVREIGFRRDMGFRVRFPKGEF
ncbi:hypothetical protein HQ560_12170 [bacterium]|nr:hypothetical protein [bacterium]